MKLLLFTLSLFLIPSYAQASEGGFFTWNLVWSAANVIVLIAGIVYLYKRFHGERFFKMRKDKIEKLIDEAMDVKQKAAARHEEITEQLTQFDKTNREIMDSITARAEKEKQAVFDEGQVMIDRMKRESRSIMDAEVQKAKQMINDHLKDQLYGLSKDYIKKNINEDTQHNVTNNFIKRIK